jgi:hypothetical protein
VVTGDRSRHRIPPREEALPLSVGEVMIDLRGLLCFNQSSASFCVR